MGGNSATTLVIIIFSLAAGLVILGYVLQEVKKHKINTRIERLASGVEEITPKEFFELRNHPFGGQGRPSYARTKNFAGVYILFNKTKNMYYVGQAQKILDRVNNHFTGKGNGDVYADYKYGDEFTIKMLALEGSGFSSLNELERHTISKYNAFSKGYNKTRGNL